MAFGENFAPVYTAPTLEDGEYRARILKSELNQYKSGDEYVHVTVEIAGKKGYNPNSIFLNEAPKIGAMKANGQPVTQDDVDRTNRQITTFFECFGITVGDFDFSHWKGKVGTVKIAPQYDKNEPDHKSKSFKQIFPQKPKAEEAKPAPTPAPAPKKEEAKADEGFPEDIPF